MSTTEYRIMDYNTAELLAGTPNAELVERSLAEDPTGAVPAYSDDDGTWHYVLPSEVERYRLHGVRVITVYVEVLQ